MREFKVGDKVRLMVLGENYDDDCSLDITFDGDLFIGKEGIVIDTTHQKSLLVLFNQGEDNEVSYFLCDDELELIEEVNNK